MRIRPDINRFKNLYVITFRASIYQEWNLSLDQHRIVRGDYDAFICVALFQIVQAAMMLFYPASAPLATCLIAITKSLKWMGAPDGTGFVAFVMIITSLAVLFAAVFRFRPGRSTIFAAQQILMTLMLGGGIIAAINGAYLDGTVVPAPHIVTDQVCLISPLWILHLRAIIRHARDPNG